MADEHGSSRSSQASSMSSVLEFVIRNPVEDWLAHQFYNSISIAPLPSPQLKRAILLRGIASELSRRIISVSMLNSLEHLHDLDLGLGLSPDPLLAAAYFPVAVECTVGTLRARPPEEASEFLDAVNRIWCSRVGDLENSEVAGLVTDKLKIAKKTMEKAASDPKTRDILRQLNTKKVALKAVEAYLKKEFAKLGPPRLDENIGDISAYIQMPKPVEARDTILNAETRVVETSRTNESTSGHVSVEQNTRGKEKVGNLNEGPSCIDEPGCVEPEVVCEQTDDSHRAQSPSFMDWNPTAETREDSIESSSVLSSPKKRAISSLKKQIKGHDVGRRKRTKWTEIEVETLKEAVQKCGRGKWKLIKSAYPDVFANRTEVDLKDKWRNITGR